VTAYRRRGLSDAAQGTPRRHLSYETGWYGPQLVVADRWFGSSKTCHACGHVQRHRLGRTLAMRRLFGHPPAWWQRRR